MEESKNIDGKTYMIGHTREYVKVAVETDSDFSNQIMEVMTEKFLSDDILCGKFLQIV